MVNCWGQNRQLIRQVVLADDLQGLCRLKDGGVNALAQILELIGGTDEPDGWWTADPAGRCSWPSGELGQLVIVGDDHDVNGVAGFVGPLVQGGRNASPSPGSSDSMTFRVWPVSEAAPEAAVSVVAAELAVDAAGETAAGCQRSRHRGCQSQRKCFFHVGFTSCKVEIKIGYIHRALTRFAPFRAWELGFRSLWCIHSVPLRRVDSLRLSC